MKRKKRKVKKAVLFFLLLTVILIVFVLFKDIWKKTIEKKTTFFYTNVLTTEVGETIDLLKNVVAKNSNDEILEVFVEGNYDFYKEGEYKLYYVAKDKNGKETKEEFTLKVTEKKTVPIEDENHFVTSKGFQGEIIDGVTYIEGTLIVNKTYALPSTFGNGLTEETKSAFNELKAAALLDGFDIYIASGFRSYDRQVTLYNNYVKRDGKDAADTYSARPGHSEHQSGLTFDVNEVSDKFHNTPEAHWLSENCYRYGFILRFPNGKTEETGFKYESWHFRYVGKELAEKLYNNGDWLTLEDYFGVTSIYQNS